MKTILILFCITSYSMLAQDSSDTTVYIQTIDSLTVANTELQEEVDSLNEKIEYLELEVEKTKWEQIKEGMTMDEVVDIMGDPAELQEADFGYKKLIFGEGYTGYILLDKELKVVDSTPPLYLRMKNDLISK